MIINNVSVGNDTQSGTTNVDSVNVAGDGVVINDNVVSQVDDEDDVLTTDVN